MEIQQIRYFLAVCETRSFTKAADKLGVSQPAITNGIKRLEAEFSEPLLHREGKRVLLSELGELMRPQFARIVEQTVVAHETAQNFRLLNQTPLRIGIMSTIGPNRFSELLARFQAENPGVELALHEGVCEELSRRLDANDLDLAVLSFPSGVKQGFRTRTLYRERYVVIFRKGHRFERLSAVRLEDLTGEPYIDRLSCELREMVMGVCRDRQVELYAKFRSVREDWIQAMVLAGIGFAFMPEHSVTQMGLLNRPLIDPEVSRSIDLARAPGRKLTPAASAFVRCIEREYHRPEPVAS